LLSQQEEAKRCTQSSTRVGTRPSSPTGLDEVEDEMLPFSWGPFDINYVNPAGKPAKYNSLKAKTADHEEGTYSLNSQGY
jgi:hypothetical protein